MNITPYLIFNGEAEEAANFYADALGGKIENLYRYSSMPPQSGVIVPDDFKQKVLHCCIIFPGGSMSAADNLPGYACGSEGKGGHMLTINCDSAAQAEDVYARLSSGARKIQCEMSETYYANRYAEVLDRYGVLWAILYEEI